MSNRRVLADQRDVTAAGRAHQLIEQFLLDHLKRMMAVRTANLHGWVVREGIGRATHDYSLASAIEASVVCRLTNCLLEIPYDYHQSRRLLQPPDLPSTRRLRETPISVGLATCLGSAFASDFVFAQRARLDAHREPVKIGKQTHDVTPLLVAGCRKSSEFLA